MRLVASFASSSNVPSNHTFPRTDGRIRAPAFDDFQRPARLHARSRQRSLSRGIVQATDARPLLPCQTTR